MPDWETIVESLTSAQRRVLDAMCKLEDGNDGWHAPIRAIAKQAGIASTETVTRHIAALVAAGAAERSPYEGGGYRTARHHTPGDRVS
jgi:DNA-binding MarR family transcriptional regulator